MATRKQLSDVLREEANKVSDSQAGSENVGQSRQAGSNPTPTAPAATPAKKSKAPAAESTATPAATAQLDTTVNELTSALEDARVTAGVLQRKIEALESDLAEQRSLVQQLKTDLKHTQQAKTELEEAKRVILQLSELNSTLETAAKAAKSAVASPQAASPAASQPAKAIATTPTPSSTERMVHPGHTSSQRSQIELHRMLDSPVAPAPASTSLSNDEIGWVD